METYYVESVSSRTTFPADIASYTPNLALRYPRLLSFGYLTLQSPGPAMQ